MTNRITMNIDETLELDYLIEQINDNAINITSEPNNVSAELDYVREQYGVFNPPETGIYKFDINGQTIEIDVVGLPDSAVHRWALDKVGRAATDSIGNADLTHNGPTRVTGTWKRGAARRYNGSDDESIGNVSDITVNLAGDIDTSWSVALTIEPVNKSAAPEQHIWQWEQGNAQNCCSIGNYSAGTLDFGCRDSSGNNADQTSYDISGISGKVRGLYGWDGSSASLFVNNIDRSGNGNVNFSEGNDAVVIGNTTSTSQYYEGVVDNIIIYNKAPSASLAQEDYDRQPWS